MQLTAERQFWHYERAGTNIGRHRGMVRTDVLARGSLQEGLLSTPSGSATPLGLSARLGIFNHSNYCPKPESRVQGEAARKHVQATAVSQIIHRSHQSNLRQDDGGGDVGYNDFEDENAAELTLMLMPVRYMNE